jgi:hypothetical protein
MPNYMLLLRDNPESFAGVSPEEMQAIIAKYSAWRRQLAESGRLVGGEKLKDGEGRVMRKNGDGTARVIDGPFSETKEVIGGFFAVSAADYDEIVEISRGCPHLEYGTIEIREVDQTEEC